MLRGIASVRAFESQAARVAERVAAGAAPEWPTKTCVPKYSGFVGRQALLLLSSLRPANSSEVVRSPLVTANVSRKNPSPKVVAAKLG